MLARWTDPSRRVTIEQILNLYSAGIITQINDGQTLTFEIEE